MEIQSGHFKQLTCRWSSTTDQLMLIVGVNYRGLSDQQLDKLKCDVKVFFDSGPGKDVAPTSLYITNLEKRYVLRIEIFTIQISGSTIFARLYYFNVRGE